MASEQSVLGVESSNCLLVELSSFPGTTKRATAMAILRRQLQALDNVAAVAPLVGPKARLHVRFSDTKAAAAARAVFLATPGYNVSSVAGIKSPYKAALVGEKKGCDEERQRSEEGAHVRTPSTASSCEPVTSGDSGAEEHLAEEHLQLPPADKNKPSRPEFLSKLDLPSADKNETSRPRFLSLPLPANENKTSRPRFLSGLELSNLNWERFAKGQEWRQDLLLRCLPLELCKENKLEAFLSAAGLKECVEYVEVTPKGRFGSAVVHATSVAATSRLAKFLHGRQLFNSKLPIAVSFASDTGGQESARSSGGGKDLLPMRVDNTSWSSPPMQVPLPPGLEDYLAQLRR